MNAELPLRITPIVLTAVLLALLLAGPGGARADMFIRLHDGRVLTVPVDESEVQAITYGKGDADPPLAKRAADRIRKDAEQIRFASEAADKAATAARRAEQAAAAATRAAEEAKQAEQQARAAAEAARQVALDPPPRAEPPGRSEPAQRAEPPGRADAPGRAESARPKSSPARPAVMPVPRVLSVGKGKAYAVPSMAAREAYDGDIVEIAAGVYRGDVAVWTANNLVIRGVGGRVLLDAAGRSAEGKATWVIKGRNTTVQNIAFTGSRVPDNNGAGIRLEGAGLVVRNCEFFDNQMGILTGRNPESDILIERSRFFRNKVDDPRHRSFNPGHNIYIGDVRSFTLRFSHVSGAQYGHQVKTRARRNTIAYNMIADGPDGTSSYLIDFPAGGLSVVVGNVLHQGPHTDNWTMVSYGAENPKAAEDLYVVNNTFVNDRKGGMFVQRHSPGQTYVINNILAGGGTVLNREGEVKGNLIVDESRVGFIRSLVTDANQAVPATGELKGNLLALSAGFADPSKLDFRLVKGSPAIEAGLPPPVVKGDDLKPLFQFVPPTGGAPRPVNGKIDIGAYEYAPAG